MGLLDKLSEFFNGQKNQEQIQDDHWEKKNLARDIIGLVDRIKRINSFDSSVWNISGMSEYTLANSKNIDELRKMKNNLERRLTELENQKSRAGSQRPSQYENALWTGEKPRGWTDRDLDFAQTRDDR